MDPIEHFPDTTSAYLEHLIATGNVVGIGVGGSRASGTASAGSDIDLYVLTRARIAPEVRRAIAAELADTEHPVEIANPYWGDEDGFAIGGVWHDVVFFEADWFFGEIDRALNQHLAREGYTTSFVFTLAHLLPVHDPDGVIANRQARIEVYPEALATAIVAANHPVSCVIHACYRNQIARAVALGDPVAANHRVAAFLACVMDIAFASLRMWHPGEKRQLQYLSAHADALPTGFVAHVTDVLAACAPDRMAGLVAAVDTVVADVQEMVQG